MKNDARLMSGKNLSAPSSQHGEVRCVLDPPNAPMPAFIADSFDLDRRCTQRVVQDLLYIPIKSQAAW